MITTTTSPARMSSSLHDSGVECGRSPASPTTATTDMATAVAMYRLRQEQQRLRKEQQMARPPSPMSRTHQYRKVMKPLLERKRRARINKCLDELKDIMVGALQTEGESITKLEKADVLELTVKHLRKLKKQNALSLTPEATYASRFRAGYMHCAQEVSRLVTGPDFDLEVNMSTRLLSHLSACIQALDNLTPSALAACVSSAASPSPLLSLPGAGPPAQGFNIPHAAPPVLSGSACGHGSAFSAVASSTKTKKECDDDKAWRPW